MENKKKIIQGEYNELNEENKRLTVILSISFISEDRTRLDTISSTSPTFHM